MHKVLFQFRLSAAQIQTGLDVKNKTVNKRFIDHDVLGEYCFSSQLLLAEGAKSQIQRTQLQLLLFEDQNHLFTRRLGQDASHQFAESPTSATLRCSLMQLVVYIFGSVRQVVAHKVNVAARLSMSFS